MTVATARTRRLAILATIAAFVPAVTCPEAGNIGGGGFLQPRCGESRVLTGETAIAQE